MRKDKMKSGKMKYRYYYTPFSLFWLLVTLTAKYILKVVSSQINLMWYITCTALTQIYNSTYLSDFELKLLIRMNKYISESQDRIHYWRHQI